jgi:EmrB/QacA subfamily drug resistance transporter
VFTVGLGLFSLTSLLCAVSPSPLLLILARGGQGIGGAIMFATSLALLAQEFHGRERGTALGIWGAAIAASAAVGPLLGGALTDGFGWSSIFYINVPVGLVGMALTVARVAESRDPGQSRLDWIGTITFTAALFALVLALIRGNADGWGSALIVGLLGASVVLLAVFLVSQRWQRESMFDLSLFAKPTFSGAAIVAFSVSAAMFSMFLYLVLYIQTQLGYSPLESGYRFLPFTVVAFFVAAATGNLAARVPVRVLLSGGLVLTGVGLLLMRGLGASSHWTALLAGFLVAGAGVGLINPTLASAAIGVVPPQRSGMASGINNTFRQVGIATGIAGLGAVFQSVLTNHLAPRLVGTPAAGHAASIARAVAAGGTQQVLRMVPPGQRAQASAAIHTAFASAMNDILLVAGIVALAGSALALVLVRTRDFVPHGVPEAAPAAA